MKTNTIDNIGEVFASDRETVLALVKGESIQYKKFDTCEWVDYSPEWSDFGPWLYNKLLYIWRVKPKFKTGWYRVALKSNGNVAIAYSRYNIDYSKQSDFVRWLTDHIEYEYEES
jgi:hypothetical protein